MLLGRLAKLSEVGKIFCYVFIGSGRNFCSPVDFECRLKQSNLDIILT